MHFNISDDKTPRIVIIIIVIKQFCFLDYFRVNIWLTLALRNLNDFVNLQSCMQSVCPDLTMYSFFYIFNWFKFLKQTQPFKRIQIIYFFTPKVKMKNINTLPRGQPPSPPCIFHKKTQLPWNLSTSCLPTFL